MFEFDYPWAFAFLAAPLVAWWLLPPYKEQQDSVRVPFFEQIASALGATPAKGGVLLRKNLLQKLFAPLFWLLYKLDRVPKSFYVKFCQRRPIVGG